MAESNPISTRRVAGTLLVPAVVLTVLVAGFAPLPALAEAKAEPAAGGGLRAADMAALAKRFGEFRDDLPHAALLGLDKITAYEENQHFVYVCGSGPVGDRSVVFCKPATFVVDDRPPAPTQPWRLVGSSATNVTEKLLLLGGASGKVASRFIRVIHVGAAGPKATLVDKDGAATVKLTTGERTFTLVLPAKADQGGTITVSQGDKTLLADRLLPSGIMPHGPKGVRMLERWDGAYRHTRMPGWDVGRAASELKKIVDDGTIRPGRALVLGCGTGTNAIYLASKGFTVTGVEVAPTALVLAERQARKAKVRVRWLLADVTAMGEMEPFDFIFDRGCYHHVQLYNSTGFVETVDRLTRGGGHFLLLAGNANQPRHGGPPRVEETKLVNDFAKTWDFVCLREIRFESRDPNHKTGPWAWSALMRRRVPKK